MFGGCPQKIRQIMLSFFIFIFGLSVGSFLNVVICRLESKEPILFGRSRCPKCGALLKRFDLIPLLSFVLTRGKCRYCGRRISYQYPLVELATGLLFLVVFNQFPISNFQILDSFFYLIIISFLIIIFAYDLKHYLIPDKIIYPAIIIALLNLGLKGPNFWALKAQILAACLASGFFLSLVLVSKGKWMGLGDVKLAFLMGLVLGWPNICLALFLSFMSGAIIGIGLIIAGKKTIKAQIPFGPFLAGATILIMLFEEIFSNLFLYLFPFI